MSARRAKVVVLGSGTSTGIPVVGCRCPVCSSEDPRDQRTRCSMLLRFGEKNILVDTSTDLRQQSLREGIRHIDAVLYTHAHADHLHGIDDLRPFSAHAPEPIPVYGSEETLCRIHTSFDYIFDPHISPGYRPRLVTRPLEGTLDLFGLSIIPVPLIHGAGSALGYRIGPFAYLTDCSDIPSDSVQILQGVETVVIDGLRFTPHITHFNIPRAISAARDLGARRILLTHLGHDILHRRDSSSLPPGVEFAYDGQTLEFEVP